MNQVCIIEFYISSTIDYEDSTGRPQVGRQGSTANFIHGIEIDYIYINTNLTLLELPLDPLSLCPPLKIMMSPPLSSSSSSPATLLLLL